MKVKASFTISSEVEDSMVLVAELTLAEAKRRRRAVRIALALD